MKGRMVNYKPYPSYKPSGVAWISEIPDKWVVRKLKIVCRFQYGKSLSENERNDNGVPVYGSNGIVGYHDQAITLEPCIVVGRKGSCGKINYSNIKCFPIDTTFYIDKTTTKEDLRWLYYLLLNLRLDEDNQDSAVPGLNREKAYDNIIPFPPYPEQQIIADFLDGETARINAIIEKQNRLIELLKEKRSGLITQAVTKGLDQNEKMKSSGVDWIGEIPERWSVRRWRFIAKCNPTKSEMIIDDDLDVQFVPMELVPDGCSSLELSETRKAYEVKQGYTYFLNGDVLVAKITPCFENGKGAIADGLTNGIGFGTTELNVYRANKDVMDNRYLFLISKLKAFRSLGEASMKGSAGQKRVTDLFMKDFVIPLPPLPEQNAIIDFLDRETAKIDILMDKIQKQINLLNEYKQSLITAAVTGKIDVRDSIYATNP